MSRRSLFLLFVAFFWCVSTFSRFAGQQADTWGSLLSAQAWLEHGSPDLTPYSDKLDLYAYQFYRNPRGVFYAYPPFPAFLEVPIVMIARICGAQMWDPRAEALVNRQMMVVALAALMALISYAYTTWWTPRRALIFAFLTISGSACLGSLGAAFNSQVPAVFFITCCQVLFLREYYGKGAWKGHQVGLLLALSYFCRPTGAVWAPPALLYVLWRKPRQIFSALLVLLVCLGLYTLACYGLFGTVVHRYFLARTLVLDPIQFSVGMVGILFSPVVGLLVYQPLVVLPLVLGPAVLRRNSLFWCFYAYILMHLTVVALQFDWWGGSTYGSRLTAETVLPLYLIAMMMFHSLPRSFWLALLPVLAWSLWLNVWGAYFRLEAHQGFGAQMYVFDPQKRLLWDWKWAPFWVSQEDLRRLRASYPEDIFGRLNQHNRQGFSDLERMGDHLYITPKDVNAEVSFVSSSGSGRQSGSVYFRYTSPRPAQVELNGRKWTTLPATPQVVEKTVFFQDMEWGAANRLTFHALSGIRLFDLEVQNWDANQPGNWLYLEGWGINEAPPDKPSFRWSYGPRAQIRLSTFRGGKIRFAWRGHATKPSNQVEFYVNGQAQARISSLPVEPAFLQADLQVQPGLSMIELRYSQWGSTSSADPRPLALSFEDLKLSWAPRP